MRVGVINAPSMIELSYQELANKRPLNPANETSHVDYCVLMKVDWHRGWQREGY